MNASRIERNLVNKCGKDDKSMMVVYKSLERKSACFPNQLSALAMTSSKDLTSGQRAPKFRGRRRFLKVGIRDV